MINKKISKKDIQSDLKQIAFSVILIAQYFIAYFAGPYIDENKIHWIIFLILQLLAMVSALVMWFGALNLIFGIWCLISDTWKFARDKDKPEDPGTAPAIQEKVSAQTPKEQSKKTWLLLASLACIFAVFISYQVGFQNGSHTGYQTGYAEAQKEAAAQHHRDLNQARDEGYNSGYCDGYRNGSNSHKFYNSNSSTGGSHDSKQTDPIVYVTEYGTKYHSSGCQYLWDSCISIRLSSAKMQGYFPCSVCNPPG